MSAEGIVPAEHPLPWSVRYGPHHPEWDRMSHPYVVDAHGEMVFRPPQNVDHPGRYDKLADRLCLFVVERTAGESRLSPCPFCRAPAECEPATNAEDWWIVRCCGEDCEVSPSVQSLGEQDAIDKWNARR